MSNNDEDDPVVVEVMNPHTIDEICKELDITRRTLTNYRKELVKLDFNGYFNWKPRQTAVDSYTKCILVRYHENLQTFGRKDIALSETLNQWRNY